MFCTDDDAVYRDLAAGIRLQTLVYGEKTLMGRFTLAKNARIPPHQHPHEQTGFMLSGRLRFLLDGEEREVNPGDSWCIPGGTEHGAVALEDSVVVEVFSPVRTDYLSE